MAELVVGKPELDLDRRAAATTAAAASLLPSLPGRRTRMRRTTEPSWERRRAGMAIGAWAADDTGRLRVEEDRRE